MIQLNDSQRKSGSGGIELEVPKKGASRWSAVDPTSAPFDATSVEVLPSLFINKNVGKKAVPRSTLPEAVIRELNTLLDNQVGMTGVNFYSYDTDETEFVAQSFLVGVEAVSQNVSIRGKSIAVGAPLTTVDHDTSQLYWDRTSRRYPEKRVYTCCNDIQEDDDNIGMGCYARQLRGAQGALQMWLSVSQQNVFDETGELPSKPGPCLLCIRQGLQQMVLAHGNEVNVMRMIGHPIVKPPFSIIMDVPGGYASKYCITPEHSQIVSTPFPMNSGTLEVLTNEDGTRWFVNQGDMVYNVAPNSLN